MESNRLKAAIAAIPVHLIAELLLAMNELRSKSAPGSRSPQELLEEYGTEICLAAMSSKTTKRSKSSDSRTDTTD